MLISERLGRRFVITRHLGRAFAGSRVKCRRQSAPPTETEPPAPRKSTGAGSVCRMAAMELLRPAHRCSHSSPTTKVNDLDRILQRCCHSWPVFGVDIYVDLGAHSKIRKVNAGSTEKPTPGSTTHVSCVSKLSRFTPIACSWRPGPMLCPVRWINASP